VIQSVQISAVIFEVELEKIPGLLEEALSDVLNNVVLEPLIALLSLSSLKADSFDEFFQESDWVNIIFEELACPKFVPHGTVKGKCIVAFFRALFIKCNDIRNE
jgi:hypothetical protein